jgi:hypothetical protein
MLLRVSKPVWTRLAVVVAFAVAMAFLESAIVVYLRQLFHLSGDFLTVAPPAGSVWFSVPYFTLLRPGALLSVLPNAQVANLEVWREVATMVMLACVAWLSGSTLKTRLAYFIFAFGVWDIGYYAFLRALLGWPATLGSLDVLFLIPGPWLAPVFLPIAVSVVWIAGAVLLLRGRSRG